MRHTNNRSFADTIADTLASVSIFGGFLGRPAARRGIPLLERRARAEFDGTGSNAEAAGLHGDKLDAVRLSLAPVPRSLFDSGERRRETATVRRRADGGDPFERRIPFVRARRRDAGAGGEDGRTV